MIVVRGITTHLHVTVHEAEEIALAIERAAIDGRAETASGTIVVHVHRDLPEPRDRAEVRW